MAAPAPTTDARPASTAEPNINRAARPAPLRTPTSRHATDDEILGLGEHAESSNRAAAPEPSSRESRNARDRAHVTEFNSPRAGAPPFASKGGDVRNVQDPTPPESDVIPPALTQEGSEASDPSSAAPPAASPHANDATHAAAVAEPEHLRAALDANPELRAAWLDANAYRETFPTPDDARAATASLADLDRMDALFFSRRPEDHAELARAVAKLNPAAFASLAQAMTHLAQTAAGQDNSSSVGTRHAVPGTASRESRNMRGRSHKTELNSPDAGAPPFASKGGDFRNAQHPASATGFAPASADDRATPNGSASPSTVAGHGSAVPLPNRQQDAGFAQPTSHESQVTNHGLRVTNHGTQLTPGPTAEQTQFFHATNAATVEGVLAAIESQVERLLPEGVSKTARDRVVGEIYRELDTTLRSNRALGQQMRDAFRGGVLDGDHQNAIVSLVTGRARQALPAVAKRVMNEWTSTVVSANQQRRERQRTAERRVDIAGSGGAANDGRRSLGPRDIDYARLSDADILNL